MKKLLRHCTLLMVLFTASLLVNSAAAQSTTSFVHDMRTATQDWRGQLSALRKSANETAENIIGGGNVYVASTQRSFQAEVTGRAGGLMMIKRLSDKTELTKRDTVLAGVDNTTNRADVENLLQSTAATNTKVLLFAGTSRRYFKLPSQASIFPAQDFENLPYSTPGIETVSNTIGLWTWNAELVAACVRRGQVPTMFTSNAMPGGRERNAQFRKSTFHETTDVAPDAARHLGGDYLKALDNALSSMERTQGNAFERGAEMLKNGNHVHIAYMGHMFPSELQWNGRPDWAIAEKTQIDNAVPENLKAGDTFFYIGYQFFPWDLTTALRDKGINAVITTSMKPLDNWANDKNIIYINPFWEVQDAAVHLRGYDIDILPTSGILQSTIYWQLVELTR